MLDLDATDDPVYGAQEGRHFHGYYDCYCYLPLYIFCGRHLLAAKLRASSMDAAHGAAEKVARIVAMIRKRWSKTTIVIRADNGFCRDDLMTWFEVKDVQYMLRLAGNSRLVRRLAPEMRKARRTSKRTGQSADTAISSHTRTDGQRQTIDGSRRRSRARTRRLRLGDPQLSRQRGGDAALTADPTPAPTMRANQLRLWLESFDYVLMCPVRRIGLAGTKLEAATCGTIRLKLLKIGALVTISDRRVKLAFASAFPDHEVSELAARRL